MKEDYVIVEEYNVALHFNVFEDPTNYISDKSINSTEKNELSLQIEFQSNGTFYVDLMLETSLFIENKEILYIDFIYRGVTVVNFSLNEEKIKEILNIHVPNKLYISMKRIVSYITKFSGFSKLKLKEINFQKLYLERMNNQV